MIVRCVDDARVQQKAASFLSQCDILACFRSKYDLTVAVRPIMIFI